MAHNPQAPYGQGAQGPEGYDPAGSTQMFRAFVDEGTPQQHQPQQVAVQGGPRVGVIAAVIAGIAVVAAVVWLAVA
ncbi:hypothetical protein [Streptomyces sp. NRRL F-5727]|uniref:hypothetical protein n=1 Tax=Streptomyces sp. NRRL F-5727 TaxID=1463871 RepID=UPI0004CB2330|nr:hypothetical protein [Streptomyces sp. NRRL F-5727]